MELEILTNLIGSVGFPIAACCVMFYQNSKLQSTLNELTKTLVLMSERIENIEDSIDGGKQHE